MEFGFKSFKNGSAFAGLDDPSETGCCVCARDQYTYNAPLDVATTSGSCFDMRNTHTQV